MIDDVVVRLRRGRQLMRGLHEFARKQGPKLNVLPIEASQRLAPAASFNREISTGSSHRVSQRRGQE